MIGIGIGIRVGVGIEVVKLVLGLEFGLELDKRDTTKPIKLKYLIILVV